MVAVVLACSAALVATSYLSHRNREAARRSAVWISEVTEGRRLVKGYVANNRLCSAILTSDPPICGGASYRIVGVSDRTMRSLAERDIAYLLVLVQTDPPPPPERSGLIKPNTGTVTVLSVR